MEKAFSYSKELAIQKRTCKLEEEIAKPNLRKTGNRLSWRHNNKGIIISLGMPHLLSCNS